MNGLRRRAAASLGATALALGGLVAAPAASAEESGEPYLAPTCRLPESARGVFADTAGTPAPLAADCLAAYGVTRGVSEGRFAPSRPVTRAQMATFLVRLAEVLTARVESPDPGFSDDDALPAEQRQAVAALVRAEVAQGYADGRFRPQEPVSRAQMASFLSRLLTFLESSGGYGAPPTSGPTFSDVPDDAVHAAAINELLRRGVAAGVTADRYAPRASVTRSQMSRFLTRTLALAQAELLPQDSLLAAPFRQPGETLAPGPDAVAPLGLATRTVGQTARVTFSGLSPDRTLTVTLVDSRHAHQGAEGWAFTPGDPVQGSAAASTGRPVGRVVAVDGQPVDPADRVQAQPGADGTLTVLLASDVPGAVVPVLHHGGPSPALDVEQAAGEERWTSPVDAYAVAGPTRWEAPPAPATDRPTAHRVLDVDVVGNRLMAVPADREDGQPVAFSYDGRDLVYNDPHPHPIVLKLFEMFVARAVHESDEPAVVEVAYDPHPDAVNTFRLQGSD